jgi:hypothetical protein
VGLKGDINMKDVRIDIIIDELEELKYDLQDRMEDNEFLKFNMYLEKLREINK